MNPNSFQDPIQMTFLESMMINYVDMDLAKKDKPLLMDKIFLSVLGAVNITTTETMKTDLINEINSSISTHIIIEIVTIVGLALLVVPLYCLLQRRYFVHEKVFALFVSLGVSDIQK
jgi:CHAT domain-containing protein